MSKPDGKLRPWRQIAQELAEERDPNRVTVLAKELTEALDAQGPAPGFPAGKSEDGHLPKKL